MRLSGRLKAESRRRRLKSLNPRIPVPDVAQAALRVAFSAALCMAFDVHGGLSEAPQLQWGIVMSFALCSTEPDTFIVKNDIAFHLTRDFWHGLLA